MQKNVVDNLAANLGASEYYKVTQSLKDPSGKVTAPSVFLGSAQDSSVTPGVVSLATIDGVWQAALQGYVTNKMIANAGDFDLSKFDLANTIFSFILGPGFVFDNAPSYCGYHTPYQVTLPSGASANVYIAFDLFGGTTTTSGTNYGCNFNTGGYPVGFDSTAQIDTVSPNNDPYLDGLAGPYTHEIFETISDPLLNNVVSWFNNDDDHYYVLPPGQTSGGGVINPSTYTQRGGNNENGDLCANAFAKQSTVNSYFNTNNPAKTNAIYQNKINANLKLPVTVGTGSPYYLVQPEYYFSPPNSQCLMAPSELVPLATVTRTLTFVNAFKDTNQVGASRHPVIPSACKGSTLPPPTRTTHRTPHTTHTNPHPRTTRPHHSTSSWCCTPTCRASGARCGSPAPCHTAPAPP